MQTNTAIQFRDPALAGGAAGSLGIGKVLLLIFVPTALLTVAYVWAGLLLGDRLPTLLIFFVLALLILFPVQLFVVVSASKKEYGGYSLQSAFSNHQKLSWWKILLTSALLWGFAGILSITLAPLEAALMAPLSARLFAALPAYFDWTNAEVLQQYPRNILLVTAGLYFVLNGFVGPIVEELFFRGYLTSKISRYGSFAPVIMTVLFSLYHFWLPFSNIFRIAAFLPASYLAWKWKNITIAIVFHVLSNLVSAAGFFAAVSAVG
jgi:uncharacterized protein